MELCKFYLIKLCLLIFLFNQIKCESEYEFDCLNEDCSAIMSKGYNQFPQIENDALLRLGKDEFISIYGVNKDYYLIKNQNREGLVKRKSVRLENSLSKGKKLITIRASFKDKKLNVINNSTKIDEQTDESINLKLSKTDTLPNNDQLELNQQQNNIADLNQSNNSTTNSLPLHKEEEKKINNTDINSELPRNYDTANELPNFNQQESQNNKTVEQQSVNKNDQQSLESQSQNFTDEKSIEIDKQVEESLSLKKVDIEQKNNDSLGSSNSSTPTSELHSESNINNLNVDSKITNDENISTNFNHQELQDNEIGEKQPIENKQYSQSDKPKDSRLNPNNFLNRKKIKNDDINVENNDNLNDQILIDKQLNLEMPKIDLNLNDDKSNDKQQNKETQTEELQNKETQTEELQNKETQTEELKINEPQINEQKTEELKNKETQTEELQINEPQINEQKSEESQNNNENQNNHLHSSTLPSSPAPSEKLNSNIDNQNQVDFGIPKNYNSEDILSASNQQASQKNLPDIEQQAKEQLIQSEPQFSEQQIHQNPQQPPVQESIETPENLNLHHHPKKFLGNKGKIKQLNKIKDQEQLNAVHDEVKLNNDDKTYSTDNPVDNLVDNLNNQQSLTDNQTKREEEQLNLYITGLRYTLGSLVNLLPEGMVLFLEQGLQISTRLLIFVFIIGLLWIVLFAIKLFYISLSNETVLKNQLCESQSKLSQLQRERDDLKTRLTVQNSKLSKGLEEQKCEVDKLINKLNHDNKQLKDSKLLIEKELDNQLNLVKNLEFKIEQLNEDNLKSLKGSEKLNEKLDEELQIKENLINKLSNLEELNKELICKNDELENQIKDKEFEMDNLIEKLDEKEKSITDKDVEIGFLNKMLDELKKSNELLNNKENCESNDDEIDKENQIVDDQTNFYDVVKLRFEIEKLEKERNDSKEKLKTSLDKIKILEDKLENLELEFNENKEMNNKIMKEKEEAEKYLDFLKKYYNENKNDLQKELGVYQYKEKQLNEENKELQLKLDELQMKVDENDQRYQATRKEFDDLEKQLSISSKSACDYFKSVQSLRVELTNAKKENEYLRQQLRNPSASSSTNSSQILPPPEMPKAVLDFFGQLSSGQIQPPPVPSNPITASGLINLNSLNNYNNNSNFMTAPSPIPNTGPQSIDYQQNDYQQNDYQQNDYQQPSYHSSFSHLPFTSQQQQQQSQNLTSIFNNTITTSSAMNSSVNFNQQPHQQMIDPLILNQHDSYAQQDYHYASLPNMSYSQQQQNNLISQQHQQQNNLINQHWDMNNQNNYTTATTKNQENNAANSPHPSLHSNV